MRVLCCYTPERAHPAALAALRLYCPQAELVDVSHSKFAYWAEISRRWNGGEDLIIIEHDNEIRRDTIASLAGCDHDWCSFAYPIYRTRARCTHGLGCTKYSAHAQSLTSVREIEETFRACRECQGKGCWFHLDGRIAAVLKANGIRNPHDHGDVVHYHDYLLDDYAEPLPIEGRPIEWWFDDPDAEPAEMLINRPEPAGLWDPGFPATGRQVLQASEWLLWIAEQRGIDIPQSFWEEAA